MTAPFADADFETNRIKPPPRPICIFAFDKLLKQRSLSYVGFAKTDYSKSLYKSVLHKKTAASLNVM